MNQKDLNQNTTTDGNKYATDRFVEYVFERCKKDKGFRARMRRANNPGAEHECWGTLCNFGVNIEYESNRKPYVVIGAAIAHDNNEANGKLSWGQAVYLATNIEQKSSDADVPNPRLRRLLACDSAEEACQVLRSTLTLIQSRITQPIDYKQLLKDLVWFDRNPEKIRTRWASDYFKKDLGQDSGETA